MHLLDCAGLGEGLLEDRLGAVHVDPVHEELRHVGVEDDDLVGDGEEIGVGKPKMWLEMRCSPAVSRFPSVLTFLFLISYSTGFFFASLASYGTLEAGRE